MNWYDKLDVTSMDDTSLIAMFKLRVTDHLQTLLALDADNGDNRRRLLDEAAFLKDETEKVERELIRRMNRRERVVVADAHAAHPSIIGRRG